MSQSANQSTVVGLHTARVGSAVPMRVPLPDRRTGVTMRSGGRRGSGQRVERFTGQAINIGFNWLAETAGDRTMWPYSAVVVLGYQSRSGWVPVQSTDVDLGEQPNGLHQSEIQQLPAPNLRGQYQVRIILRAAPSDPEGAPILGEPMVDLHNVNFGDWVWSHGTDLETVVSISTNPAGPNNAMKMTHELSGFQQWPFGYTVNLAVLVDDAMAYTEEIHRTITRDNTSSRIPGLSWDPLSFPARQSSRHVALIVTWQEALRDTEDNFIFPAEGAILSRFTHIETLPANRWIEVDHAVQFVGRWVGSFRISMSNQAVAGIDPPAINAAPGDVLPVLPFVRLPGAGNDRMLIGPPLFGDEL